MPTKSYPHLFKPLTLDGLRLKNRITMASLYLGYAGEGGKVSPLILHRYRLMARSGAELVVVPLAQAAKKNVSVPVISAGRISSPKLAESILDKGKADLIGLARMLWADPLWVKKARQGREGDIVKCSPTCNACMELVMKGRPAFCTRWDHRTREEYKALFA